MGGSYKNNTKRKISEAIFIRCLKATSIYIRTIDAVKTLNEVHWMSLHVIVYTLYSHLLTVKIIS